MSNLDELMNMVRGALGESTADLDELHRTARRNVAEQAEKLVAQKENPANVFVGRIGQLHERNLTAEDKGVSPDIHALEVEELRVIVAALDVAGAYIYTQNQHLGPLLTPTLRVIEEFMRKVEHLADHGDPMVQQPF